MKADKRNAFVVNKVYFITLKEPTSHPNPQLSTSEMDVDETEHINVTGATASEQEIPASSSEVKNLHTILFIVYTTTTSNTSRRSLLQQLQERRPSTSTAYRMTPITRQHDSNTDQDDPGEDNDDESCPSTLSGFIERTSILTAGLLCARNTFTSPALHGLFKSKEQ